MTLLLTFLETHKYIIKVVYVIDDSKDKTRPL